MNTYQAIATFLIRLLACCLGFLALLHLGHVVVGLALRSGFYGIYDRYYGGYIENWSGDVLYLVFTWLLLRFSARLGRFLGRDLGPGTPPAL